MSVRGEMIALLEKKGKKTPREALGSLQRWLKGANPAVKSYKTVLEDAVVKGMFKNDPESHAALVETASLLKQIHDCVLKLNDTVDDALKGF